MGECTGLQGLRRKVYATIEQLQGGGSAAIIGLSSESDTGRFFMNLVEADRAQRSGSRGERAQ